MRFLTVLVFAVATVALALQAFAATPSPEAGAARTDGVYASLNATDAAACAALCAQDSICMAWTFREGSEESCALTSVVAAPVAETGALSGLSRRAPDFAARFVAAKTPSAPEAAASNASTGQHAEAELLGAPDALPLRPRS